MSFRAVLWALDQNLKPVPKLILVAIASHANVHTGAANPKVRTIARMAAVSPRTVFRKLPVLTEGKLLRIEPNSCGRGRLAHTYHLPCPIEPNAEVGRIGTRGRATGGTFKNHLSNHNIGLPKLATARNQPRAAQVIEQKAQVELARRLGREGWNILTTFDDEVPRLCAQLLRGELRPEQLADLKARYIQAIG